MVWTAPKTWVYGEVLYAADLNTALRDSMLETEAAKATESGMLVTRGSSDPDPISLSKVYSNIDRREFLFTSEEGNTFTSGGPFVEVPRASSYWIFCAARIELDAGPGRAYFAPEISDMFTIQSWFSYQANANGTRIARAGLFDASSLPGLIPDYTDDTYTFGMRYGCTGISAQGRWAHRSLAVIPIGRL